MLAGHRLLDAGAKDKMASEHNNRVTFIATYEDGRQVLFTVYKFTLTGGDYALVLLLVSGKRRVSFLRARS